MERRIKEIINKKNIFAVICHKDVEPDALGSSIALFILLKRLGKKVFLLNQNRIPSVYKFLPYTDKFRKTFPKNKIDICFVLDSSNLPRIGRLAESLKGRYIINIDHHISNSFFGTLNWVDAKYSSTSEMIYRLYKLLGVDLDRKSALCIYAGIVSDTGSFSYENTSSRTHDIASELIRLGISANKLYRYIYDRFTVQDIKFVARVLSRIQTRDKGRIIYAVFKDFNLEMQGKDLSEFILSFMRSIKDSEVAILFKLIKGGVRINFRSKDRVDVNRIASFFGGGGHRRASAATVYGDLEVIKRKVFKKIEELL